MSVCALVDVSGVLGATERSVLADVLRDTGTFDDNEEGVINVRNLYNPAVTRPLLQRCLALAEGAAGRTLYPVCTFVRDYQRHGTLIRHRDRDNLDVTLSVELEADAEWPLQVEHADGSVASLLPAGDQAAIIEGRKLPHGRPGAYAGERCMMLLLHYSDAPNQECGATPAVPYIRIAGLLDSTQIQRIYDQMGEPAFSQGMVGQAGAVVLDKRNSHVAWLRRDDGWMWLRDAIRLPVCEWAGRAWPHLDTSYVDARDDVQFSRYEAEQHYDWHVDTDSTSNMAFRSVSCVVLLRDPDQGGGIELRNGGVVPLKPGDALIFGSDLEHRALPVVAGTRDSLALWLWRQPREDEVVL